MRKHTVIAGMVVGVLVCCGLAGPAAWASVDANFLLDFIEGLGAPENDVTGDGRSDFRDLLQVALSWGEESVVVTPTPTPTDVAATLTPTFTATPTEPAATHTPTPTATPTQPTQTPTPTPTSGGNGIHFADYFPLGAGDTWHYIGFEGGSVEDNFRWTVQATGKDVGGGKMAARMKTDTDEASDDRNQDEDFWVVEANGDVYFYGFHNGQPDDVADTALGKVVFPVQDVIFTDPLRIGTADMVLGATISDTGACQFVLQPPLGGPITVNVTLTSNVNPTLLAEKNTPLGVFTQVLRVVIDIDAVVSIPAVGNRNFSVRGSTMFVKKNTGMIAQDQKPDPNDAELQGIDSGTVNGQAVQASKPGAP